LSGNELFKNIFNYNHANLKVDWRYLWLPVFAIMIFNILIADWSFWRELNGSRILFQIFGVLITASIAGVLEEFIFRGALQLGISKLTRNLVLPVVLPALIFGLVHFFNLGDGVLFQSIYAFILGMFFGIHRYANGRLMSLMLAHALINFTGIVSYDLDNFEVAAPEIYQMVLAALVLVPAIISFIGLSLKIKNRQLKRLNSI